MKKKIDKEPSIKDNPREEQKRIQQELEVMKLTPGWKRIVEFLDKNIKYYEELILDGDIKDMQELKLMRSKRDIYTKVRNLPDILIEHATIETQIPAFDPYIDPTDIK